MKFVKATILGGVVFLIPVVVLVVVIGKAFGTMVAVAQPMAGLFPVESVGAIALANILAALLLLALCFAAGLIAQTEPAARALDAAESAILQKIPGYTMLKGLTTTLSPDQADHLRPVVVTMDSSARVGLEVDRLNGGRVVVFIPGAPNAWAGTVHLVDEERVERVDVPMTAVIEHSEQFGRNSETIFKGSSLTNQ